MGFLGTLGKGLALGGAALAAPFTGGGSLAAIAPILSAGGGLLSGIGSVAGGAAKGAQDGRQQDAQNQLLLQQIRQQNAQAQATDARERGTYQGNDTFRRGTFAQEQQNDMLQRPSLFGKQALMGGLMANLQDVNISRPAGSTIPTFNVTGGLRPSAMGQDARDAGAAMSKQALMHMLSGGPAPIEMGPQADLGPGYQAPPDLNLPQAGTGEKLLGGLGLVGGLLGGIGQGIGPRGQPQDAKAPVDLSQPNPLVFSKRPYQNLFAPSGGLA